MPWIVLTILFSLITVGCFVGGKLAHSYSKGITNSYDATPWRVGGIAGVVIGGLLLALGVLVTGVSMVHQVPAGHVGVVYTFSDITGQTEAGLQVIAPWQAIKNASVQVQTLAFVDDADTVPEGGRHIGSGLDSFSTETQNVYIDAILRIKVSPDDVQGLYREVGENYVNKLIPGSIAQVFKDETVDYNAVDVAPSREIIRSNVEDSIRGELLRFSIDVDALLIENIHFESDFETKIQEKQNAVQEALKEQELVAAETAKADQKIEAARGEAERLRIVAAGQAEANSMLAASLTPLLVQFQAMQKLADDLQIAILPGGEGIIIDPSTLLGQITPGVE